MFQMRREYLKGTKPLSRNKRLKCLFEINEVNRVVDFGVNEMQKMQKELQEKYKDKWESIDAETGKNKLLWIDVYKRQELCVADADAISHFDNVPGLLYLAYVRRGLDIEEGKGFVKNKLERSFQKLSDLSKEFYWDKYNKIMEILE